MAAQALHLFGLSQALLDFHLLVRAANALAANPNPITTCEKPNRNPPRTRRLASWRPGAFWSERASKLESFGMMEVNQPWFSNPNAKITIRIMIFPHHSHQTNIFFQAGQEWAPCPQQISTRAPPLCASPGTFPSGGVPPLIIYWWRFGDFPMETNHLSPWNPPIKNPYQNLTNPRKASSKIMFLSNL